MLWWKRNFTKQRCNIKWVNKPISTATQVKIINEEEKEEVNTEGETEDEEVNRDDKEKLDHDKQMPVEVEDQQHMIFRDRGKLNKPIRHRDALFSACNDPVTYRRQFRWLEGSYELWNVVIE